MSKVIMGNGGFYSYLSEPQGVLAWWKETPQTRVFVLSRSLLLNHLKPQSSKAKLLLPIMPISVVAYAFTLLWDNLCRNSCIRLLVFISTTVAFSFRFTVALKRCYFQSWKVLIPHFIFQLKARSYSKWSEIWSSFKTVASLLRRYSGFHRTPPDRAVTWKGFLLFHQEKITLMKD